MILSAIVLDLIIGDPPWLPHPIIGIGHLISSLERLLYPTSMKRGVLLLRGSILVFVVVVTSFIFVHYGLKITYSIHPLLSWMLTLYFLTTSLSLRGLYQRGVRIKHLLEKGDLEGAREKVWEIVGRDTENLNEEGVVRGTLESLAENISDGFIAPLFYMVIGGAPLAILYKAVNTLDSMVGYKNQRYLYFGRMAAYLDDVMNYIPARLTLLFFFLASLFLRLPAIKGWRIALRDGPEHKSPNAGYLEAFLAGVLMVQLGGPSYYQGELRSSPYLGDRERPLNTSLLREALLFIACSSLIPILLIALYNLGGVLW